ncbi:MAG: hypothetical protein WEH44_07785, partial [Pirellulaceae bacterium]
VGIVLFPFLAVLICTMGALVVLLMLLVQQAKVDAESSLAAHLAAKQNDREQLEEQKLALEDARWRQEILERQRLEKQQELADRRLELAHIEDHIRRLEDAARKLTARLKALDEGKQSQVADLAPLEQQLAQLQQVMADKQKELDEKRKKLAGQEQAYALIPYEGRSGTKRMPLYVECVEEGVILQPEGLLLVAADFDGPTGPGNPLDAALRAKREYLAKVSGGQGVEPYPLLVVRPSGVMAYQAAKAAMKAWEDEYGYELVAENLNLDFGECDIQMDQALRKVVRDARRRQQLLAAAMPRQYRPVAAPSSFVAEEDREVQAMKSSAPGRGAAPVAGSGGMGIGQSQQYADGRAARKTQQQPASAASNPPPPAGAPKTQHGGNPRQEGVKDGVAGAKSGKSLPPGMAPQRRGSNWGLPGSAGRTFGVTRPIRVICLADRVVLLSDRRDAPRPQEITLSEKMTAAEVDLLVTSIHKQMESWGLAAENGYWKPVLLVEVVGDAESRLAELQAALEGSGIEVNRKQQ